jgi:hypothetical protein
MKINSTDDAITAIEGGMAFIILALEWLNRHEGFAQLTDEQRELIEVIGRIMEREGSYFQTRTRQ